MLNITCILKKNIQNYKYKTSPPIYFQLIIVARNQVRLRLFFVYEC